ncbi:M1 family aminopeptidase [Stakelama sediminis]|uniref:Aminopeptidase N n=1 Tax=Stakelama sediminis TaxID=463200 RepID=A0A840Z2X3_9SPHN|nr:M1 family metallopeptidase [Stakelama sediminis]MBB5720012.1 aminopeptidase N [Stakelama sediminis]
MISRYLRPAALLALSPLIIADHPVSPDTGYDILSYAVTLAPDAADKSVHGRETIHLRVDSPNLKKLIFSANALHIHHSMLNNSPVEFSSDSNGLSFLPRSLLHKGETVRLSFDFDGTPKRGIHAIPGGLYSSYFACDWMVCLQNSPGDKALLRLDLVIPAGLQSLGPGKRVGRKTLPDGRVSVRWQTRRPYSPYLYGFAFGSFVQQNASKGNGREVYLDATGGHADLKKLFAQTPAIVSFLSRKAGVSLPAGNYSQLLVPGYEAQEATTYSLIGEKALARDLTHPDEQWIIVHELSHQWWGNLVTCATWRDLWLNEGFATFMTAAWKEHRYGKAAYEAELDVARSRLAKARAAGFDKPLSWGGAYPSIGIRRAVQYSKGALFLDHLRQLMGDNAFWRGIRHYTRDHAGGTVTSADFQNAMQHATKRDLSVAFNQWVYGRP